MIAVLCFPTKCLQITDVENDDVLRNIPVKEGQVIVYHSIHSVSNTPLEEHLAIQGKELSLKEVRYIDQGGAGMPEYGYGSEVFENKGDYFVISNFQRVFPEIIFNIQEKYKNRLVVGQKGYDLTSMVPNNKRIAIGINYVPNIYRWLEEGIF